MKIGIIEAFCGPTGLVIIPGSDERPGSHDTRLAISANKQGNA